MVFLQCFGDCWTNPMEKTGSSLSSTAWASRCPCQVSILSCPLWISYGICLSDCILLIFSFLSLLPLSFSISLFVTCTYNCISLEGSSLWSQLGWPLFKVNGISMMNDVMEQVLVLFTRAILDLVSSDAFLIKYLFPSPVAPCAPSHVVIYNLISPFLSYSSVCLPLFLSPYLSLFPTFIQSGWILATQLEAVCLAGHHHLH